MKKWTKNDIKNLKLGHNLHDNESKSNALSNIGIKKGKISVEKSTISTLLWVLKKERTIDDYCEEFQFDDVRKFRFDWAIPTLKIAIEYEGLMSEKSGHTTIDGYSKDCQKYNLAIINGWKVLRYTAVNYKNLEKDLKNLIGKLCNI